jgi:translation initiation factor 2B subunit (eIF-2B alpha/beta/delta family)
MSAADGAQYSGDEAVARIRADKQHGASWLAREAARALARASSGAGDADARLRDVWALGRALAQTRPSMAAIANAAAHIWWVGASHAGEAEVRLAALRAEALALDARWDSAIAGMTQWARGAVDGTIYTLSRSGSAEGTLTALARERSSRDPLRVIVSESRPGGEGVGLARALAATGAQVTLAADSACAALMDGAALVIVGADSVRADGSVVNKVGTHTLALVARAAGKPVYALAEWLKVTPPSYPLVIETMESSELLAEPVVGVTSNAIVFDVTPAALITSVVMESGPVDASAIARMAQESERAYQSLMHL